MTSTGTVQPGGPAATEEGLGTAFPAGRRREAAAAGAAGSPGSP